MRNSGSLLRLLALTLVLALSVSAADWVIVRRDGARIECDGAFLVVNGNYVFTDRQGRSRTLPAAEVDATKTAAANAERAPAPTVSTEIAKTGDFLTSFNGPFPSPPSRNKHVDYQLEPSRETFFVHVPSSYTGAKPYGLIVFTDAGDRFESVPPGWAEVLDRNNLLFVAAQASGNEYRRSRRLGLAVLGALEIKKGYNIDAGRIYAAGFSGGARTSNQLGFYQSDLFKGTIQNCGADFYEGVQQREATVMLDSFGQPYGLSIAGATAGEIERAKRTVRFVLITGSQDFRRGNILDIYRGGYAAAGFQANLLDVPGMSHDVCDGRILAQAIAFLESR
jgi:hypothetical protein